jgi:hypothetical protein
MAQQSDSHSCDTLPRARPSSPSLAVSEDQWSSRSPSPSSHPIADPSPSALSQPAPRKLCIRHQRIADEGTNLRLQQVRPNRSPFASLPERFFFSLVTCIGHHFQCQYMRLLLYPRPSTTFRSEKENPSMQSGQASRHPRTHAGSSFFGAS